MQKGKHRGVRAATAPPSRPRMSVFAHVWGGGVDAVEARARAVLPGALLPPRGRDRQLVLTQGRGDLYGFGVNTACTGCASTKLVGRRCRTQRRFAMGNKSPLPGRPHGPRYLRGSPAG